MPAINAPELPDREVSGFIEAWNEIHETLQGSTTPYLARVAGAVGLEKRLLVMLGRGSFHNKLVAIIALGHVKNSANFQPIARLIDDKSPVVSLCAARALMEIDPSRAMSMFVPQIVRRNDWSQGSIAQILQQAGGGAGGEAVSRELSEATLQANADIASRLVRFLAGVSPQAAKPIIRKLLDTSTDEHLMSTCLQVMSSPDDLDCVRALLSHPRWHVRMQAAVTLGRLGNGSDEALLTAMLPDQQWWVRYRAAQALLRLPAVGEPDMRRIQQTQTDRYARDIIDHVLAERALGALA